MALKPEPIAKSTVCSVCGLAWERHAVKGKIVPVEECIRLLKADLATVQRYRWPSSQGFILAGSKTATGGYSVTV